VCCSDATLIFRPKHVNLDDGTKLTREVAKLFRRPNRLYDPRNVRASEIIGWLEAKGSIRWLNVAGPSRNTLKEKLGEKGCRIFLEATRKILKAICR
jgi:putative molybdenum carrier protein